MESLKAQLRSSVGLMLAYPHEAEVLKVDFNGLLLFGPAGTGRTHTAQATAGEYGLNFIKVSASQVYRRISDAFRTALENTPCILYFDELDAIARRRDDGVVSGEERAELGELLQNLDAIRKRHDVFVMAATSDLQSLDQAVLRPGRFDRHIRFDLPDGAARKAILKAQLRGRPCDDTLDYDELAERCKGSSAARIKELVNEAALVALHAVAEGGVPRGISQADLHAALEASRAKDRPTVDNWTWDQLILPGATKRELQEVQRLIESPDRARALGIMVPTGVLLYGPPGTGKTTVARVLAAQAKASFYPIKGSDVVSKWLGESEHNLAELFARARANAPSIIFIDEIDALAATRSGGADSGAMDRILDQLLQEIDGLGSSSDVFVLGATNRPDLLDVAVLRGGRLGRHIEIPLPNADERRALLKVFTRSMPLAADVNADELAAVTAQFSGAGLQALCHQAGVQALLREESALSVTAEDFKTALEVHRRRRSPLGQAD